MHSREMHWGFRHCQRSIMRILKDLFLVHIILLTTQFVHTRRSSRDRTREPKLFSLFNIVQFANERCSSNSGGTSGTCFTAGECAGRGGRATGSCAAGFGVCCVFVRTGGTVTENCTYLRNVGFPATLTGTTAPTFMIRKISPDICTLRLDFLAFTINGPADSIETNGGACNTDSLTLTSMAGEVFPVICGQNSGQHAYVEMGGNAGDTATLTFAFSGQSTMRMFNIKASQIPCGSMYRYTACIRQEAGYCCVEYQVCNVPDSFSIQTQGKETPVSRGRIDNQCDNGDYVVINGASAECSGTSSTSVTASRICGSVFFPAIAAKTFGANIAVCDCQEPFQLGIITNGATDPNRLPADLSRGVCLRWRQLPCN